MAEEWNIPFFLSMLLDIRGIVEKDEVEAFLSSSGSIADPMEFRDMDKAVYRINQAIDSFEKICVYGDYDADGVTSTVLLYTYLESIGANVMYYIPKREEEGYGLNNNAIDKLKSYDVSLIITVDNGVVAIDEVEYAKSLGIDMVITDHHQPREELPNAAAVVDPHRKDCGSKFKDLSGVGVAFKLIMAIEGDERDLDTLLSNYSDLVAIGTIADVVSLKGENRFFVKKGLEAINNTDRPGIKSLLEQAGMYGKTINSTNIAFTIVPRINAGGRMTSSERAVKLLLSENEEDADSLSACLNDENKQRQKIEHDIFNEIEESFAKNPEKLYQRILIVCGENWHPGVIGIVASKILEKYGKPVMVISSIDGMAKGSGRSVEGFSLYEAVLANSQYLTRFGGHPMAAGINLESKNVDAFKKGMEEYVDNIGELPFCELNIDCKLNPSNLSVGLIEQISEFEPFGADNHKPIFALCNMVLKEIIPVAGGKHLRLKFQRGDTVITVMKFFVSPDQFPYDIGDILDLAVNIEINEYYGNRSISIIIKDYKLSNIDQEKFLKEKRAFEQIKRGEKIERDIAKSFIPKREEFAKIYRYLRNNKGFNFGIDVLLNKINDDRITFGKAMVILDIMSELDLINIYLDGDNYHITVNQVENKVELESSKLLQKLKSWRN